MFNSVADVTLPALVLLLMGLALRMSLRLIYGARGPAPDDVLYLLANILSWALLLAPTAVLVGVGASWLAIILGVFVAEAIVESVVARRETQRQGVWRLLLDTLAGNQFGPAVLRVHSPRFTGVVGRSFRLLMHDLDAGMPLLQALHRNRRALPREAVAYAAVTVGDTACGRDAQILDDHRDPAYAEIKQQIRQRISYLSVMGFMLCAVIAFMMIKIVPAFQGVYVDFDLELPPITISMISFAEFFQQPLGMLVAGALFWAAVGALAVGFCYLCDVPVLRPVIDRLAISRHRSHVMRLLAAAIACKRPIPAALRALTDGWGRYPSAMIRRKLLRVLRRVEAGQPLQEALAQAGLLSGDERTVLETAQHVGNLAWALQMLAARRLRIMAFHLTLRQHVIFTAIMLLLGMFVLWFAVAMTLPLSDLILRLSA